MLAQSVLRAARCNLDAQPRGEQQVVQLLERVAAVVRAACQLEMLGVDRRVAQALVDRRLPQAPEGERLRVALAGFGGGELARLDPRRRFGLRQQRHRVEPGERRRQQLLALAGGGRQRLERGFEARTALGEAALGDVDARADGLRFRRGQARKQLACASELFARQQRSGKPVVQMLGHRLGRAAGLREQPVDQAGDVGAGIVAHRGEQAGGQGAYIRSVEAAEQLDVEGVEQGRAQGRCGIRARPDQRGQVIEGLGAAPAVDDDAHRPRAGGAVEHLQAPGVLETVVLAPGAPPELAAAVVVHEGAKALPAGVARSAPAPTLVARSQAEIGQLVEQAAHLGVVKGAAAHSAQTGRADQIDQLVGGERRLRKRQGVEDPRAVRVVRRRCVGQERRLVGGHLHRISLGVACEAVACATITDHDRTHPLRQALG